MELFSRVNSRKPWKYRFLVCNIYVILNKPLLTVQRPKLLTINVLKMLLNYIVLSFCATLKSALCTR